MATMAQGAKRMTQAWLDEVEQEWRRRVTPLARAALRISAIVLAALAALALLGVRLGSARWPHGVAWGVLAGGFAAAVLLVTLVLRTFRAAVGEARRRALELDVLATLRGREVQRLVELERRLEETHRAQTLGRLAAGAVADLDNALSIIDGASAHLLNELAPSPERDAACTIHHAAARAGALTRQLLDFGRGSSTASLPTDVREVLRTMRPLLQRLAGDKVVLHIQAPSEACSVLADRAQLEQLVVNLVLNARDAMPDGGQLTIAAGKLLAAQLGRELVSLSVVDTGAGMDASTRRRIFDPFFTTNGGTGLGLTVVHRIVTEHGGRIHVESRPGAGARFDILLPAERSTASA
jgi:signal transduction histidine kinase